MSEVEMEIPMESLLNLPDGAVYADKSGQASIKVSHKKGADGKPEAVYVYASCDSLQLQCERYEKTVKSLREQITALEQQNETIEKNPPNAFLTALKWLLFGFVIGATATAITIVIIIKKRN